MNSCETAPLSSLPFLWISLRDILFQAGRRRFDPGHPLQQIRMGITVLEIGVANPARSTLVQRIEFLVDSGTIYSVVPSSILRKLGIKPLRQKEQFRLADGSKIERRKGGALFEYGDKQGFADVVFGEPGDSVLLGALTLEALGLALDPLKRELLPLPMILAGWRSPR